VDSFIPDLSLVRIQSPLPFRVEITDSSYLHSISFCPLRRLRSGQATDRYAFTRVFHHVLFTGRIALRSWVITSFPSSMVPFLSQRCETYSFRPHLLSSKKCGPTWLTFRFRSLYVTSSQVATKLIYDCLELPANLAGSCSESLMLVIRQKCGTSRPTFLLTAIIRAKLARISNFGPSWS